MAEVEQTPAVGGFRLTQSQSCRQTERCAPQPERPRHGGRGAKSWISLRFRATPRPIRKLTGYQPDIDAIRSNYRPLLLSLSLTGASGRENPNDGPFTIADAGARSDRLAVLRAVCCRARHVARPPVERGAIRPTMRSRAMLFAKPIWPGRIGSRRCCIRRGPEEECRSPWRPPRMMAHHAPRTRQPGLIRSRNGPRRAMRRRTLRQRHKPRQRHRPRRRRRPRRRTLQAEVAAASRGRAIPTGRPDRGTVSCGS